MDNLSFPVNPIWFLPHSWIPTPNNGLLYISGKQTTLCYVPPIEKGKQPDFQFIYLKNG